MSDLLPFLLLAVLLSITPGPDAVLVLRSSVRGGRWLGSAAALGAATGSLLWGILATVGLAAVITQSAALYQAIRLAGAAYLIFLGVRTLLTHTRGQQPNPTIAQVTDGGPPPRGGMRRAFGAGLLSDLLNPKVGLSTSPSSRSSFPPGRRCCSTRCC